MRAAGQLVAEAHQRVSEMLEPGIPTRAIDAVVARLFASHGAIPLFKGVPGSVPYPSVTCISVNEQVVHGIPGDRELQEGDIVSVDTGCRLNGWCADAAWTYSVGQIDELKQRLLQVGKSTLALAICEMGRRRNWIEVAELMELEVRQAGFEPVEEFVGHGIGREMHEDPQVVNCVNEQTRRADFSLRPGLVLAIEPMVNAGSRHVRVQDDGWTVVTADGQPSVHFEHTVALTDGGPEILTEGVGKNSMRSGPIDDGS